MHLCDAAEDAAMRYGYTLHNDTQGFHAHLQGCHEPKLLECWHFWRECDPHDGPAVVAEVQGDQE